MVDVPSNLIPTRISQLPVAPVASADSILIIVYQGNNYQIRAGDLLQVAGVPTTTQVIAGTSLTGGGQLTGNVTLSVATKGIGSSQLADSGVTAGVYGDDANIPVFTVDITGRVVAATTVPASGGGGGVPTSRQIIAGTGLTGGGTLASNVTLNANLSSSTPLAVASSGTAGTATSMSRSDHQHPAITLSSSTQVSGELGLSNGGTGRSLTAVAGAVIWCGADGLYVGAAGTASQVLLSGGTSAYSWANQSALAVGTATNLAGGAANRIAYQTGAAATSFVAAPSVTDTYLKWDGSAFTWATVAGSGTVTSVAMTVPSILSVSGSPITSSGTLAVSLATQTANTVFAGATSGGVATPTFRALVDADIPAGLSSKAITSSTINSSVIGGTTPAAGTFTTVTLGTALSVANGGTGATTAQAAMNTFAAAVTSGQYLRGNGTNVVMSAIQAADVPTLNQNTSGNAATATSATTATNLAGGAANRIAYQTGAGATGFAVAPTITDTFLKWDGAALAWAAVSGAGTVTSVAMTVPSIMSVSGSPITSSGTLAVSLATQTANTVFAGATSGGAATPAFRALVDADIPTTMANKTLNTPTISGGTTNNNIIGGTTPAAATVTVLTTTNYTETTVTANTSTAYTIDLANGTFFILTLTGNCTFTFPTATSGKSFTLFLKQDATGSRTVTWPAAVKWPSSTAPTITSTASKADKFVFTADGSNWIGSVAGQNYL